MEKRKSAASDHMGLRGRKQMRILFVGALWKGSTGLQRMVALHDLGHKVTGIDTMADHRLRFHERVVYRLGYQLDTSNVNSRILRSARSQSYELIWVDKTLSISPRTLRTIKHESPNCRILFYSPDDMMLRGNQTHQYRACVPVYDLHITTKSYNVSELQALGARDVLFIDNAFDPHTHFPIELSASERAKWQAEVGFVGGFEKERFQMMLELARTGVQVSVRGPGWEPYAEHHKDFQVESGWVAGQDYARAICATKINLGFLRKIARDLQTTRSIEIPACGGFMLAERTDEHLRLFTEGEEAEFFLGVDELISKVHYYLYDDAKRERVARAGRQRCLQSGYSNQERLESVLEYVSILC